MMRLRKANERGHVRNGWLESWHTFSFADYHDPEHMGFRTLRVINEDFIAPGQGFGTHPHRDMEIITYVIAGTVAHRDSMNNVAEIRRGEIQVMSAGTGITHSEFNASDTEQVHLLQIWIMPEKRGLQPAYGQQRFAPEEKHGSLHLLASRDGRDGSMTIHQDADLYAAVLHAGAKVEHRIAAGRALWLQMVTGDLVIGGTELAAGDGLAVSSKSSLDAATRNGAEFLLFDLM